MQDVTDGVISLRDITKAFPGVVANDHVSLDIVSGQVHCLLGENGAGKSTLISILSGMQQPDSGEIRIDGEPVEISSPRVAVERGIGVVHQHSTLIPAFTVLENLMLGETGLRLDERRALERLDEISRILETTIEPHVLAGDLGLGQQQQVEIAKAMWAGSRLLILDEPTSMLTPQAIESLAESIASVKARGIAVVFITHKLREAVTIGDCVTVLRTGRKVGELTQAELSSLDEQQAQDRILAAMFGDLTEATDGEAAELADLAGTDEAVREVARIDAKDRPVRLRLDGVSSKGPGLDVEIADVSLEVREGEVLGIAGIDGHGQSALAETVAGQRPATSGSVTFDGDDVTSLGVRARQRRGLRFVTDDRLHEGTVADMSVALNLVLKRIGERPMWRWGQIDHRRVDAEARSLIDAYGIRTPSPRTRAGTLSGGNIQKILLARELREGARLVVVHKPTYGLDLKTVGMVRQVLLDFVHEGGSVLLLSTDLDELVELSHRIAVISTGRVTSVVDNVGEGVAERVGQHMTGVMEGEG